MELLHVAGEVFAERDEEGPAAFRACGFLLVDLGLKALDRGSDLFDFVEEVSTLFAGHRANRTGWGDLVSEIRE